MTWSPSSFHLFLAIMPLFPLLQISISTIPKCTRLPPKSRPVSEATRPVRRCQLPRPKPTRRRRPRKRSKTSISPTQVKDNSASNLSARIDGILWFYDRQRERGKGQYDCRHNGHWAWDWNEIRASDWELDHEIAFRWGNSLTENYTVKFYG